MNFLMNCKQLFRLMRRQKQIDVKVDMYHTSWPKYKWLRAVDLKKCEMIYRKVTAHFLKNHHPNVCTMLEEKTNSQQRIQICILYHTMITSTHPQPHIHNHIHNHTSATTERNISICLRETMSGDVQPFKAHLFLWIRNWWMNEWMNEWMNWGKDRWMN